MDIQEQMIDEITKRGILSSALGYITGLATKHDLDRLRAAVYATDEGIERAARAWRVGTSQFVTAFKLEQKRMENIDSMLALQGQSIRDFHRQIQRSFYTQQDSISFLSRMLDDLTPLCFQVSDIDHLCNAVQVLNNGKLPHAFVNHTNPFAAVQHLQFSLLVHHSHLTLIVPATSNLNYYYTKAKINTFRHDNKLIICLHVPLTVDRLLTPLTVY